MNEQETEKFIKDTFSQLPRKPITSGSKEAVWLRVQNSIRKDRITHSPHLKFIFKLRLNRLTITALSIILAVFLVSTATTAAEASLPGETLYPVKKATEYVEKVLATSDEKKAKVIKKHAQNRLQEFQTLIADKQVSEEVVTKSLEDLKSTTEELQVATSAVSEQNPELVTEAIELAEEGEAIMTAVEDELEGEAKIALKEAITASRESIAALKEEQGEVEGVATEEKTAEEEEAAVVVPVPVPLVEEEEPKKIIEAPVQTHGVIKGNPEEKEEIKEPKILPDTGF